MVIAGEASVSMKRLQNIRPLGKFLRLPGTRKVTTHCVYGKKLAIDFLFRRRTKCGLRLGALPASNLASQVFVKKISNNPITCYALEIKEMASAYISTLAGNSRLS